MYYFSKYRPLFGIRESNFWRNASINLINIRKDVPKLREKKSKCIFKVHIYSRYISYIQDVRSNDQGHRKVWKILLKVFECSNKLWSCNSTTAFLFLDTCVLGVWENRLILIRNSICFEENEWSVFGCVLCFEYIFGSVCFAIVEKDNQL